ncbi:HAD-IIB family hydrolase [uncultured Agrobacterium sp.]|uniref:HAD-IIB family hydrolase n=1 Tax=uncultured Agrobacterium sp. TaxID=157277 RepID=UPI0025E4E30D|nr:HAD-IIB family hydrolase [uncultured Agrobacterium sp.]
MKPVKLFSSDLDGTLVGNNEATARFRDYWHSLPDAERPLLVFNSGRLIDDQLDLIETVPLPRPDYIIGGVGTMLFCSNDPTLSKDYVSFLGSGFDPHEIARVMQGVPEIRRQPDQYQHGLKSSWYLHDADQALLSDIERRLGDNGIMARIVYSSGRDLDILPRAADKGAAIRWLCDRLSFELGETVVAGDTGNDRAMFELPQARGIAVGNALPELKSYATGRHNVVISVEEEADGVISGLKHWMNPATMHQ